MRVFGILILAVCAIAGTHVGSDSNTARSPILVELFTSEGCSSCPPADAWVQKMDASQPVPGAELIVLSEHVDYWNHDGWKDPYSSSSLTERQRSYSRALGLSDIYTPQVIINGTAELQLNNPKRTSQIFQKAASPTLPVRISVANIEGDHPQVVRARVETDVNTENQNADVFVVIALDHAESQVLHGENGGKRLTHVAVVQSLKKIGRLETGKSFHQDFQVKLKSGTDSANIRIIAFVQEAGLGKVLGAALQKPPL